MSFKTQPEGLYQRKPEGSFDQITFTIHDVGNTEEELKHYFDYTNFHAYSKYIAYIMY